MGENRIDMSEELEILGQTFCLDPSGALFWMEQQMLIISDVHLGKITHFRKHGSAVPLQAIEGNFRKLDEVVYRYNPLQLVFLGDLFHSSLNQEWSLLETWLGKIDAEVRLVEGNHDIVNPAKYDLLGVHLVSEYIIGEFLLRHHPGEQRNFFTLAGHVHPGVRLRGAARQHIDLPCFLKSRSQMILPAFGEFTGKHLMVPKENDEVFIITEKEVMRLKK